jgi:hypothetical protein
MEEKFDRGSALTIFRTDRHEDLVALVLAFAIAALVYFLV